MAFNRIRAGLVAGVSVLGLMASLGANAQTIEDSMASAYNSNPSLLSGRAQLRATDEALPQALAGWRPVVTASGTIGKSVTDAEVLPKNVYQTPRTASLQVTQPIYRGGRTVAGTERAKNQIQAQRARLSQTEQSLLLDVATAYMNVLRDRAIVDLNRNNEQVLNTQLEATRDRFRVGEVTRTDVSQAEARLSGAVADRIAAENTLQVSAATFERTVGAAPGTLNAPRIPEQLLPASVEDAQRLASTDNPNVIASQFDEGAAQKTIDEVRGELLPTLNLVGSVTRQEDNSLSSTGRINQGQIVAQLSVPLYEAGSTYSRVRQAKQTAGQRRTDIDVQRRSAVESATQAYENLESARARIESLDTQIRSNQVALEGVRQEQLVGSRTVLDVLNAEQELLNAQVNRVRSERDYQVAAYQVLASVGRLNARQLSLPVDYYDVEANFNAVKGKWIGAGIPQE